MKDKVKFLSEKLGPLAGLVFVYLLFCIPAESRAAFVSIGNVKIILTQSVIIALSALGMTLIIVSGGIDLSVGSCVAFTSVVGALLLSKGFLPPAVLVLVLICGGLIGLINGLLISGLRM